MVRAVPLTAVLRLALVALLAGCGGGEGDGTPGTTVRGVTDSEIILGSHTDLSGPLALQGTTTINGFRLAFEEANGAGGIHGRSIRFIVEDSAYQVPRAIQVVNKLIHRDGVFAMVGAIGTPMNNAVMPTLFDNGVLNIFPATGARSMSNPFRPLQFTGLGTYYQSILNAMDYFIPDDGYMRVCSIYQDTDFGQEIFDAARDGTAQRGMSLTEISAHKPADSDFTTAVLRLRKAECELILMGTAHRDTILILEAAQKLGWTEPQWVGSEAALVFAVAEVTSGSTDGFVASATTSVFYQDQDNPPAVAAFLERFIARYGESPEYLSIAGYALGSVLVEALKRAGPDLNPESLTRAFESIDAHTTIFGNTYQFGPGDHDGAEGTMLLQVRNGRWVPLGDTGLKPGG